ncbi:MAG: thioredoxin family protein [Caldisphaera sp.]|jgi:thioredoxin 1|nr:thioredoxin family protein [Caldisphaera sp.]PMP60959.1 MAG: thioredoxin [Caldisphaera sp.]
MSQDNISILGKELSDLLLSKADLLEKTLKDFIVNITSENLNDIIKNNNLVFLFFTAEWCGPCITFMQSFREVASMHLMPKVTYGKVDVDSSYSVADKFKIKHIPSILIIVNGEVVDTVVGQTDKDKLESKITSYIKSVLK